MNGRFFSASLVVAVVLAAAPLSVSAQDHSIGPFVADHPVLAASLDRLRSGSAAWREAVDALAATGRRAFVVTPDKVNLRTAGGAYDFDSEALAGAQPIADYRSRVDTVIVVVNLALLQRMSGLPMASAEFEDDVDRIVAHEVYGHAVPFLIAGHLNGTCADPERGQSAADACAIKRENVVRKELKLGQRFDYGREGLALAQRFRR